MDFEWRRDVFHALDLYPASNLVTYADYVLTNKDCLTVIDIDRRCINHPSSYDYDLAAFWLLRLCALGPHSSEMHELLPLIAKRMLCPTHRCIPSHVSSLVNRWSQVLEKDPLTIWSPLKTLQIERRQQHRCVGWAGRRGLERDCTYRIAAKDWNQGLQLLKQVSRMPPESQSIQQTMSEIARLMLCKYRHSKERSHDQMAKRIQTWTDMMERWRSVATCEPAMFADIGYAAVRPHAADRRQDTVQDTSDFEPLSHTQSSLLTSGSLSAAGCHPRPSTPTGAHVTVSTFSGLLTPPSSDSRVQGGRLLTEGDLPTPPSSLPRNLAFRELASVETGSPTLEDGRVTPSMLSARDETSGQVGASFDSSSNQQPLDDGLIFSPATVGEQTYADSRGTVLPEQEAGADYQTSLPPPRLAMLETFNPVFSYVAGPQPDRGSPASLVVADTSSGSEASSIITSSRNIGHQDGLGAVQEHVSESDSLVDECGHAEIVVEGPCTPATALRSPTLARQDTDTSFISEGLDWSPPAELQNDDLRDAQTSDAPLYPGNSLAHIVCSDEQLDCQLEEKRQYSRSIQRIMRKASVRIFSCLPWLTGSAED